MALAVQASGTLSTTVGTTPDILATSTTGKTLVLSFDLTNLAGSSSTPDFLDAIVLVNVLTSSSGSAHEAYRATYQGGLVLTPVVFSVPVPAVKWAQFQLNQTQGTSRSIDWSLISID